MVTMKHTIVALVEDKPGVLSRMANVFRRRGFNIESVNVLEIIDRESGELPRLTRIAIVVGGSTDKLELVKKHLEKIVDVVKVSEVSTEDMV